MWGSPLANCQLRLSNFGCLSRRLYCTNADGYRNFFAKVAEKNVALIGNRDFLYQFCKEKFKVHTGQTESPTGFLLLKTKKNSRVTQNRIRAPPAFYRWRPRKIQGSHRTGCGSPRLFIVETTVIKSQGNLPALLCMAPGKRWIEPPLNDLPPFYW